jgi:hypothetical protein
MPASQQDSFCLSTSVFLNKELTKSESGLMKINHPESLDHASTGRDANNRRCSAQALEKVQLEASFSCAGITRIRFQGFSLRQPSHHP